MEPGELSAWQFYVETINAVGVTGILILLLILFVRGDILPRKVHDTIVEYYRSLVDDLKGTLRKISDSQDRLAALLEKHDRDSEERAKRELMRRKE